MRTIDALVCCAVFALLAACGAQPEAQKEPVAETPTPVEVPPLQDFGGIGGDFALVDQHGARFELQSLRGQPAMLFFGYTYCPDICPVTLSKMGRVYQLLDARSAGVDDPLRHRGSQARHAGEAGRIPRLLRH